MSEEESEPSVYETLPPGSQREEGSKIVEPSHICIEYFINQDSQYRIFADLTTRYPYALCRARLRAKEYPIVAVSSNITYYSGALYNMHINDVTMKILTQFVQVTAQRN